jgi:hypothetical protein
MMQGFEIHKLLREPLLHFLEIGAGLFLRNQDDRAGSRLHIADLVYTG